MLRSSADLASVVSTLKRRHVVRVAVMYSAAAIGILAVTSDLSAALGLPPWAPRLVVTLVALGFPVAIALAWAFDITPEGIRRTPDELPASATSDGSEAVVRATSIAVLPFVNMSAAPEQEYFSDGLTEEILNALCRIGSLRVVARTSSFSFKGRNVPIGEIAEQLHVAHVLEGSVRWSGDRLRVTAQLIDAKTGFHLWSETYDRLLQDVFAVQDEIARSIVLTMQSRLTHSPATLPGPAPAGSLRAYQLYLQGRYRWNQRTVPAFREAVQLFLAAIAEDDSYAPAYTGLADAYLSLVDSNLSSEEQWELLSRAEQAAQRALQLDPGLAEAHTSLGHLRLHFWNWAGAEESLRRAIAINPGYAITYQYFGILLTLQGRFSEGLAAIRRALHLDPLSLSINGSIGYLLYLSRRYAEAAEHLNRLISMDPARDGPHVRLGMVLIQQGRLEEAVKELGTAIRLRGGAHPGALPLLGFAYARMGRMEEALAIRAGLETQVRQGRVSPLYSTALLGVLGENDRAFEILEALADERNNCLVDLPTDPVLDPLRGDVRFAALLARMGVEVQPGVGAHVVPVQPDEPVPLPPA